MENITTELKNFMSKISPSNIFLGIFILSLFVWLIWAGAAAFGSYSSLKEDGNVKQVEVNQDSLEIVKKYLNHVEDFSSEDLNPVAGNHAIFSEYSVGE